MHVETELAGVLDRLGGELHTAGFPAALQGMLQQPASCASDLQQTPRRAEPGEAVQQGPVLVAERFLAEVAGRAPPAAEIALEVARTVELSESFGSRLDLQEAQAAVTALDRREEAAKLVAERQGLEPAAAAAEAMIERAGWERALPCHDVAGEGAASRVCGAADTRTDAAGPGTRPTACGALRPVASARAIVAPPNTRSPS